MLSFFEHMEGGGVTQRIPSISAKLSNIRTCLALWELFNNQVPP